MRILTKPNEKYSYFTDNKEIIKIISYALDDYLCLILKNASGLDWSDTQIDLLQEEANKFILIDMMNLLQEHKDVKNT